MPAKMIARWGNLTVNGLMFVISGMFLLPFVRPWATAPALDWVGCSWSIRWSAVRSALTGCSWAA